MRASGHGRLKHVTKEPEAKGWAISESPCALANAVAAGASGNSNVRLGAQAKATAIENSNLIPLAAAAIAAAAGTVSDFFFKPSSLWSLTNVFPEYFISKES